MSLVDSTQLVLETAMRGSMQRQAALTSDLANADTAGFKPQDINFQDQLQSALQAGTPLGQLAFASSPSSSLVAAGGVGVNTDAASADLAENGLTYQALAQVLAAHDTILEYAMGTK